MVRLSYVKEFLSGNLSGLVVDCSFVCPDNAHALGHIRLMQQFTHDNPGSDCGTGSLFVPYRFVISNV